MSVEEDRQKGLAFLDAQRDDLVEQYQTLNHPVILAPISGLALFLNRLSRVALRTAYWLIEEDERRHPERYTDDSPE